MFLPQLFPALLSVSLLERHKGDSFLQEFQVLVEDLVWFLSWPEPADIFPPKILTLNSFFWGLYNVYPRNEMPVILSAVLLEKMNDYWITLFWLILAQLDFGSDIMSVLHSLFLRCIFSPGNVDQAIILTGRQVVLLHWQYQICHINVLSDWNSYTFPHWLKFVWQQSTSPSMV